MACATSACGQPMSAFNIFDKFFTHTQTIFGEPSGDSLIKPKYKNTKLSKFCLDFFGEKMLGSVEKDVFITATQLQTKLLTIFSSNRAKSNPFYNNKIVDVLLATTAAPTFFPPYSINNIAYIDGGVQANNPSFCAIDNIDMTKIQEKHLALLSLGTGHYVETEQFLSNVSETISKFKGSQLYWAKNLSKYIFEQEKQADNFAFRYFQLDKESKYIRLQPILPKEIILDDYKSMDELLNIGYVYIEDLYSDEKNRFQKFLEFIS